MAINIANAYRTSCRCYWRTTRCSLSANTTSARKRRCYSNSSSNNSNTDANNRRITRQVNARGVNFHIEQRNPSASHQILCLAGSLGTALTDYSVQLNDESWDFGTAATSTASDADDPTPSSSSFGLVAIDPRGLGGSSTTHNNTSAVAREYPPDFYLLDALDGAAVMSALGHPSYSVMGWSDGANAAIHLASHAETKDSVNKLVVWGGNAYVTKDDIEAYEAVRNVSKHWSERMRNDKANAHGGVEALQVLNDKYTNAMAEISYQREGDICLAELHQITCPTLILHGAKDVICHEYHAQYMARHIPNSKLVILPEGKHNLHMKHADEFSALVKDFLYCDVSSLKREGAEVGSGGGRGEDAPQPDIDQIAYGFMGSKALFAALRAALFDIIDAVTDGSKPGKYASLEEIESSCDSIQGERLRTLLSACVALRLIRRKMDKDGTDQYRLPHASAEQLCQRSRKYWGDYLSMQVDGQFYNRLADIDSTLRTGTQASHGYESWFASDPEAAKHYTKAQHNGSLATAYALHKRLPELQTMFPSMRMLDVGGGSGAFSIATARKMPDATAVVLDLPNVIETANNIIMQEEETVQKRVRTLALSATDPGKWDTVVESESFDVVLMSYVSGSIPSNALPDLYQNAFGALRSGGLVILHDFFVDNNGRGPTNAALWALAHVSVNPEGMGLVPHRIIDMLTKQAFVAPRVYDLIPGMTQVVVAKKPIGS